MPRFFIDKRTLTLVYQAMDKMIGIRKQEDLLFANDGTRGGGQLVEDGKGIEIPDNLAGGVVGREIVIHVLNTLLVQRKQAGFLQALNRCYRGPVSRFGIPFFRIFRCCSPGIPDFKIAGNHLLEKRNKTTGTSAKIAILQTGCSYHSNSSLSYLF